MKTTKKKLMALFIVLTMMVGILTMMPSTTFANMENDWIFDFNEYFFPGNWVVFWTPLENNGVILDFPGWFSHHEWQGLFATGDGLLPTVVGKPANGIYTITVPPGQILKKLTFYQTKNSPPLEVKLSSDVPGNDDVYADLEENEHVVTNTNWKNSFSDGINVITVIISCPVIKNNWIGFHHVWFGPAEETTTGSSNTLTQILITTTETQTVTETETDSGTVTKPQKGDINFDGKVNGMDLLLMKQHILEAEGKTLDPGSQQFRAADMNDDGVINGMDVLLLKKKILG